MSFGFYKELLKILTFLLVILIHLLKDLLWRVFSSCRHFYVLIMIEHLIILGRVSIKPLSKVFRLLMLLVKFNQAGSSWCLTIIT